MSQDPLSNHPDLHDTEWLRTANRRAKKNIRRMRRKARRGRRLAAAATLIVIIALGFHWYQKGVFNAARPDLPAAAAGMSVFPSTTATSMIPDVVVDLTQPFAGTPAAGWSDGEAGIVAPPAAPVGKHTAAQVEEAYTRIRQVLIESRLDRRVVEGHDVEPFLALLAPESQAHIRADLADPAQAHGWTTSIADGFRLLPVQPKVNGRMWAESGTDGQLVVHTNYVFAYAFHTDHPDRLLDVMDIVVVDRSKADYEVLDDRWPKASRGIWATSYEGYTYSMACGAAKKGLLAPAYSERVDNGPEPSRKREDFFDPNQPLPTENGCPE